MRKWTRSIVMAASLTVTSLLLYGCGGDGGGSSTNTPFAPSVNKSAPAAIPATGDSGASVYKSIGNSAFSAFGATAFTFENFVNWTNPSMGKAAPVAKMLKRVAAVVTARKALPLTSKQVPKAVNLTSAEYTAIYCPDGGTATANEGGTGNNFSFSLNFVNCKDIDSDGSYELLNGPMSISGTLDDLTGVGTFTASQSLTWTEYNNSTENKVLERWSDNISMANGKFTLPIDAIDPSSWEKLSAVTSGQYIYEDLSTETPYKEINGLQGLDVTIDETTKTLTVKSGSIGSYYYEKNVLLSYQTSTFDNLVLSESSSGSIVGWIAFAVGGPDADPDMKSLNGTYHIETVPLAPAKTVLDVVVPIVVRQYKLNGGTTSETLITYYDNGDVSVKVGGNDPKTYTSSEFEVVESIYIFRF